MPARMRLLLVAVVAVGALAAVPAASAAPGDLDPGFGSVGMARILPSQEENIVRGVAIQPDGKIVVAGAAKGAVNGDFLFARYNSDGSPDLGFGGGDGFTIVPVGAEADRVEAAAIGGDGKIVATGEAKLPSTDRAAGVAVVLANGTPDPGFAGGGIFTKQLGLAEDSAKAIGVGDGGRLLPAAEHGDSASNHAPAVLRLDPSGALDPGFGSGVWC